MKIIYVIVQSLKTELVECLGDNGFTDFELFCQKQDLININFVLFDKFGRNNLEDED